MPKLNENSENMRTHISRSKLSGLIFPVGRTQTKLKNYVKSKNHKLHVGSSASIYLTAVLECLVAKILNGSKTICRNNFKLRINPRHIRLAIDYHSEFSKMLKNCIINGGGVIPNIEQFILAPNKRFRL